MSIYANFQMKVSADEISGGSSGMTFWKIRDSTTGHFFALKYDYTGNQFQVFSSLGPDVINIPWVLVDAYNSFGLRLIGSPSEGLRLVVFFNGTNYGSTPGYVINMDFMLFGAMDNTSGELVDHYFKAIRVGSVVGGSDIFGPVFGVNTTTTVVPPFDAVVGGTFEIGAHALHVHNSGATTVYVDKRVAVTPPPPPTPTFDEPSDASIIVIGNSDWHMSGQPAWIMDHWGMDKLVVPFRGSRRTRDAFIAQCVPWMPWPHDVDAGFQPTMFLADVSQEQHGAANFPQINLTYMGKRGGTLPPDKTQTGEQIQQISGLDTLSGGTRTLNCTFISKTSELVTWSRDPIDLSTVEPLEPPDIDLMWITETGIVNWPGNFEHFQTIIESLLQLSFVQRVVTTGNSEELVPSQYFRASRTKQRLVFPLIG